MFETKRFHIRFQKTCIPHFPYIGDWYEVTDAHLMNILNKVQDEYKFEVLSVKLKPAFNNSRITIRCKREDCSAIFAKFCKLAGRYVDSVKM